MVKQQQQKSHKGGVFPLTLVHAGKESVCKNTGGTLTEHERNKTGGVGRWEGDMCSVHVGVLIKVKGV